MTEEHDLLQDPGDSDFLDALLDDDPTELYEHAPCGYISTLPDGTIVKANQTFLTWSGYAREALVGRRRIQELFGVGDRIFYETHCAPLLQMQGAVREIAVDLVLRDGTRLPVLTNAVLKRHADGSPMLIRSVFFDARERRTYERELVAARERAELAEARARELAQTLQATFVPPTALEIPGLDIAGVYRPAGDGNEVGGDFYDVFPTGHGTHAVVLGDVAGKGAGAAVVTALARHVVRSEILHNDSPAGVLTVLHDAVRHAHPERMCTAVLLDISTAPEPTLTIASAGHELPIRTDGVVTDRIGSTGTVLGILETIAVADSTVVLGPHEVVVLYTDGVSEARDHEGAFFGEERVAALAAQHAHLSASAIAEHIAGAAVAYQHGDTRDDIAVVVLRLPLADVGQ